MFAIVPILATTALGLSASEIGFALMLGSVSGLVAAYPAGWVADYFGRKAVIVPATVMAGASMAAYSVAPNYAWFMAASIVWGIASTVGGSAPAAYAADSAPTGMNAAAMSTFRWMGDAGYVVGPLALGAIVDAAGSEFALILSAAVTFAAAIAFAILAPETYRGRDAGK